jgi:subtilase family serine protease
MSLVSSRLALAVSALLAVSVSAVAEPAFPSKATPAPLDLGAVVAQSGTTISVTLPLKLRNIDAAESLLQNLSDKNSASYHKFLTPQEFRSQFGPSDEDVAIVVANLATHGLSAERSGAMTLKVTGSITSLERAFQVSLHTYQVPARGNIASYQFRAPTSAPTVPAEVSSVVQNVIGLSTRPSFFPHNLRTPAKLVHARGAVSPSTSGGLINPLGALTVADFDKYYDVSPLIAKNITGERRTVAIVTLASFTKSDAFAYWKAVGLKVKSDRITVDNIDGGPGKPSDESGSDETTLDVEQSGGIAPGANIVVYQAPNTNQAFLDAFVKAVESNKADSISTSWGEWEWYDNLANGPVSDPYTGKTVSSLAALHEILLQAALQGQSVFAAAGDAGAYDANDGQLPPDYSLALSVDNPASDSFITAAGGTTLAGPESFALPDGSTFNVTIPYERVWSWDYLEPLCADLKQDIITCGIFPVGGGGGVSFEFPLPFYQRGIAGIQKTEPDQAFVDEDSIPPQTLKDIPQYYAGRNVPDISFNADPDTGYFLYYTSDQTGFSTGGFAGGTSFVAPQLNGVVALIGQYLHGRVGLLNIPMYELARQSGAYTGKHAPFNVIKHGNNDFYTGRDGYSPAVGIGTLDVANFADALKGTY